MRKTSHDGGDSTSITSGVDNEIRKSAMKPKKSSLKRKAPNFHESDETVVEPLLQREKDKTETNQSAKYFTKAKTDSIHDKDSDEAKLVINNKTKTTSATGFCGTTESLLSMKDYDVTKTTTSVSTAPLHNYMNTNVFNTHESNKVNIAAKTQILVEIDGSKQSSYNPSPLIFTTAKIHTDAKSKHMEPVQVTPVPILSTIEANMSKGGSFTTNEKKISNGSSVMSPAYSSISFDKVREEKSSASSQNSNSFTTATNKNVYGKSVTTTSALQLSSSNSVQYGSKENTLPSTTTKPFSMINNPKDKKLEMPNIQKDQFSSQTIPPTYADSSTSNGSSKTTAIIGGKVNVIDMTTKASQDVPSDKYQINKSMAKSGNIKSINLSTDDTLQFVSNIKSPVTLHDSSGISNSTKNTASSSRQLQRQKTVIDEKIFGDSNIEPFIKIIDDPSAKITCPINISSQSKVTESTSVKESDKLAKPSANSTQNLETKLTSNTTSNTNIYVSSMSTTIKPIDTGVTLSNSKKTDIPKNSSMASSNTDRISSSTKMSPNTPSDNLCQNSSTVNAITVSETICTSPPKTVTKTSAIPMSISSVKSSDTTIGHSSNTLSKTSLAKVPTTIPATTTLVCTGNSKVTTAITTKTSPTVTLTSIPGKPANSFTNTSINKPSSITTLTKVKTPASASTADPKTPSNSSSITKNTQRLTTLPGLGIAMKAPSVSTSIKNPTVSNISSKITTPPNTNTSTANTNKKPTKAACVSTVTKIPSVTTSAKALVTSSSIDTSNAATVKSANKNSSSTISSNTKPSTIPIAMSIPAVTTTAKISPVDSTINVTCSSSAKCSEGTFYTPIKDPTVVKKTNITKTSSSTTDSPTVISDLNAGITSKTQFSGTTSVTTTTPITGIGTIANTKTPPVTTTNQVPLGVSKGTIVTSTTEKTPTAIKTMQTNSNKKIGEPIASTSLSDSVQKPGPIKKSSPNSNRDENDSKISKA